MKKPTARFGTKLKIGIGLFVLVSLIFVWINARPVPIQIGITFTGFTNLSTTYTTKNGTYPVTLATFCVSNIGKCAVYELGLFGCEITNDPVTAIPYGGSSELFSELKPGQFKNISITAPWDNHEPWRVVLAFSKADWRYKLMQKPQWLQDMVGHVVPERWILRYHSENFHSQWLPSPELTSPHAANSQSRQVSK